MACERIGSKARLDCVSPLSDALELMTNGILPIFETVLVLSFLSSAYELFIAVIYILYTFKLHAFKINPYPSFSHRGAGAV